MPTIDQLKIEGHRLIDEYTELAHISNKKVYDMLRQRMNGRSWHFGQMNDKNTIKIAMGHLKKMIASIKYAQSKPVPEPE